MDGSLPGRTIVLLGIGHTNAHVLRMWRMSPIEDARLVCISNFAVSTYSGMLPGVLAGDYERQQMGIDLVRLCAAAGALLIQDEVVGLDSEHQQILFRARPALRFDALSIGIGSVPVFNASLDEGASVVPIKPMQTFEDRLSRQLLSAQNRTEDRPLRVAIVGGGVAGIEIAFCLPPFLHHSLTAASGDDAADPFSLKIVQKQERLVPELSTALRRRVTGKLEQRGVDVHCGHGVTRVQQDHLTLENGQSIAADVIVWSTGAAAPPLLSQLNLPTDDRGFLLTDQTLKTTAPFPVFAVGDCATFEHDAVPKAGVYAVRQGPVLWNNLQRLLKGAPLEEYWPQKRFLKLLNCGDGTAMGEYASVAFEGRWVWALKKWIDTRFVEKFRPDATMKDSTGPM